MHGGIVLCNDEEKLRFIATTSFTYVMATMEKDSSSPLNKNRIVVFVVLSYSISWLVWMPNVLSRNFNVGWSHSDWLHILGGLGPLSGYGASILEGGFGFLQYFIHPNKQTVHDRIAETIVVKADKATGLCPSNRSLKL